MRALKALGALSAAAVVVTVALGGCASFGAAGLVERGDRLAVAGDLPAALRAYDDALAQGVAGATETRARAGRTTTAAALAARDELQGVRDDLARRESELARVRADIQKLTRDLSARDGELSRAKQDLTRLAGEAEQLRSSIEDLKRLEIRMERRSR